MITRGKFLMSLLFFAYLGRLCRALHHPHFYRERVIGGEPAEIKDFPYQLSLEVTTCRDIIHVCGASVISKHWVLTAAHCIKLMQDYTYRIRAGTSYRETGGQTYTVEKAIMHPQYAEKTWDYDIAVIKVYEPIVYNDVCQPIEMAKTTPPGGTPVLLSGWGCLNMGGIRSEQLHNVTLNVKDHEACRAAYQEEGRLLSSRMLCAFPPQRRAGCKGDSGGPLVTLDYKLVGIVSWGDMVSKTVFADVAYLRDWVTNITGPL